MAYLPARGGLTPSFRLPNPPSFGPVSGRFQGNNLPAQTGDSFDTYVMKPGPGSPAPGYVAGGQLGANDGTWGSNNPPNNQFYPPRSTEFNNWDEGKAFDRSEGHQSFRRYGLQGFNDKLRVVDRHAFYDTGNQLTGLEGFPPAGSPNTYNNPLVNGPRPDLRTVNRTVSYQRGSDKTRNQDDLSRAYTGLGEQGSGWIQVNGGVPGLYNPYGSRGGVPFPIVSPAPYGSPGDGRQLVFSGPPHGLHSMTYPDRGDTLQRYVVAPQMRSVRFDRPSNSPQAGQSFNQTVVPQGQLGTPQKPGSWKAKVSGRGWIGTGQ
jgi:hypothetical protein